MRRGVRIMSICNGAKALASAGLLDGRQATVHWYSRANMARKHPKVRWRRDARWVTDDPITTTAARLKQPLPSRIHDGRDYHLTLKGMATVVANRAAFWTHEDVALPLALSFDEIAFGTALDAWSRTYRSTAWATGPPRATSAHGLVVYRAATPPAQFDRTVRLPPPDVMLRTFQQVSDAHGPTTARFVALQFEHPWGAISAWP